MSKIARYAGPMLNIPWLPEAAEYAVKVGNECGVPFIEYWVKDEKMRLGFRCAPLLHGVTYKLEFSYSRDGEAWAPYEREFVAQGGETKVFADIEIGGCFRYRFERLMPTSQPYIKTTARAKPPKPQPDHSAL